MKSSEEGDDAQRAFDLSIGAHLTSEAWSLAAFLSAFFCDLCTWDLKMTDVNGVMAF